MLDDSVVPVKVENDSVHIPVQQDDDGSEESKVSVPEHENDNAQNQFSPLGVLESIFSSARGKGVQSLAAESTLTDVTPDDHASSQSSKKL